MGRHALRDHGTEFRPGFTNKLLGRLVHRVFTAYPQSAEFFPGAQVIETGNPVRWQSLPAVASKASFRCCPAARARAHQLRRGGSAQEFDRSERRTHRQHQTGVLDFMAIKEAYASLPFVAEVMPFIEAMDVAYAKRIGALPRRCDHGGGAYGLRQSRDFGAVSYAIYDHQRGNAQHFRNRAPRR